MSDKDKTEGAADIVVIGKIKKITVGEKKVQIAFEMDTLSAREFKKVSNFLQDKQDIELAMTARQMQLFGGEDEDGGEDKDFNIAPGPESEPTPPPWSGEKPKSKRGRPKRAESVPGDSSAKETEKVSGKP